MRVTLRKNEQIYLDPGLAEGLGFPPEDVGDIFAGHSASFVSPYVVDPHADFKLLYIYSDLVEPQIVGDTVIPLLRVIPVKGQDGEMVHEVFDRSHYIQVTRKKFQMIKTFIKDTHGSTNVIRTWEVDRKTSFSTKVSLTMFVPYKCCAKSFDDYYTRQSGSGLIYCQVWVYINCTQRWVKIINCTQSFEHHLYDLHLRGWGKQIYNAITHCIKGCL